MNITEFEAAVFAQKPTGQQHYDETYWLGEWRADDNNYSLETRRRIEAKNPQLIKDVFQPTRVIDLGCGPGALMHLLHEIGVEADGIDYNEMSLQLATPEVRDHIAIGETEVVKGDGTESERHFHIDILNLSRNGIVPTMTLQGGEQNRQIVQFDRCSRHMTADDRVSW